MNSNIGANEAHEFDWNGLGGDVVVPEQAAIAVFVNPLGKVVIRQAGQHHPDEGSRIVFAPEHAAAVAEAILVAAGIHDADPIKAAIPKPGDGTAADMSRLIGVSPELTAVLLRTGVLSRLELLIDQDTLERLRGAASRASKSSSRLIADIVRAAFPHDPRQPA